MAPFCDGAMIDAHYRRDAHRCSGEEQLVAHIELAAGDRPLDDFDAQLARGKLHDGVARDAFKNVFGDGGGDQLPFAHHEEVAGCAFGNVAAFVEEDGLVESRAACFVAGQRAVDIGAADLGARRNGIVLDAPPGADAGMQPVFAVQIFAKRKRGDKEASWSSMATPMRSALL